MTKLQIGLHMGTNSPEMMEAIRVDFAPPNYTQVPNDLLDQFLPDLSEAELKVLLYLIRRTIGFHRDRVEVGLRRICDGIPGKDRGTGLHLETVSVAARSLEARGLLQRRKGRGGRTEYTLRFTQRPFGNSEHKRSEFPNTSVYGKPAHVERKSSSETYKRKERSSTEAGENRTRVPDFKSGNSKELGQSKLDDDEKPPVPSVSQSPEEELRSIYRSKTGEDISRSLMNRISDTCELAGISLSRFLEELRPHVPNKWKNPPGFLTDFARKFRSNTAGSRLSEERKIQQITVRETPRCERCRGTGRIASNYCDCQMGRDLKQVEQRPGNHSVQKASPDRGPLAKVLTK